METRDKSSSNSNVFVKKEEICFIIKFFVALYQQNNFFIILDNFIYLKQITFCILHALLFFFIRKF